MLTKPKAPSRILQAVHETAVDLHRLGFIDKRKMHSFDALRIEPVPDYDGEKIRALRDKHPSGPSLKLLSLLERKGLEAVL